MYLYINTNKNKALQVEDRKIVYLLHLLHPLQSLFINKLHVKTDRTKELSEGFGRRRPFTWREKRTAVDVDADNGGE